MQTLVGGSSVLVLPVQCYCTSKVLVFVLHYYSTTVDYVILKSPNPLYCSVQYSKDFIFVGTVLVTTVLVLR